MERDPTYTISTASLQQIRSWITHGIALDMISPPAAVDFSNTFSVTENGDLVRRRLSEYIDFGAVKPLPPDHPLPFGVQPLHVITRPDRKPRLVIDLSRNLNDHLEYVYFQYSSTREAMERSYPGCWYSKLDLSNCFLSFPLHPTVLPHFIFRFEGALYQFVRMPFGLSSAPRICTELLSVVRYRMHMLGMDDLVRYLDDFLFINDCEAAGRQSIMAAESVFDSFGLVVNPDKTEGPSQRIAFLGVQFDSVAQTIACTPERIEELIALLEAPLAHPDGKIRLTQLQSLIGKLQFATQVLPGFRPWTHRLQSAAKERERSLQNKPEGSERRNHFQRQNATVRFGRGLRADAHFWLRYLRQWNGRQLWRSAQSAPFIFASDASLDGFGFYLESVPFANATLPWPQRLQVGSGYIGVYSPDDATLHRDSGQMTWCELFAVYAALVTWGEVLSNCCVLFLMDNSTDVGVLNKQSTRSDRLAGLLREIYLVALQHNISIYARHRPGVDNVLADFLSRPAHYNAASSPIEAWRIAHPDRTSALRDVYVVYSQQFVSRFVGL